MTAPWVPRVAPSANPPEGAVRACSWTDAQAWCNFVLFRPADLPAGVELEPGCLRPEAPPGTDAGSEGRATWTATHRAAHRCIVRTPAGLVRLKQFLYDWAPAAFDHPALWRSAVRPFAVGPRVGWLGTDYLGHPAASLHAHRTLVELSVLEGTVHDEVLADLCRSLVPVSASACACIDATSLADLSYARRHEDPVVTVPVGYFHHHRRSEHRLHARAPRDVPEDAPGSEVVRRLAHRMRSDAVFLVGDPEHPCEVDWVLRRPEEPDDAVRILVGAPDGPDAIAVPPSLDAQPCESEVLEVGTARVHHAWADDRFGPHEAVWREARQAVMLLARPRGQTNAAWFRALLADILEGRPSAASGVGPQPS